MRVDCSDFSEDNLKHFRDLSVKKVYLDEDSKKLIKFLPDTVEEVEIYDMTINAEILQCLSKLKLRKVAFYGVKFEKGCVLDFIEGVPVDIEMDKNKEKRP